MSQGISFKTCGGSGANARLESFFTVANTPRTYTIEGGDLSSPIVIESTNAVEIVTNLSSGEYIAKMIYQGEELLDAFVIDAALLPQVSFSPSTICQGQSSTLTITGSPGGQFLVTKPGGATNTVIITTNNIGTLPGITVEGEYTVTALSQVGTQCYPFTISKTLEVGGQALTPAITLQPGAHCVGQPIPFRIEDGGVNATYNVSSLGSGTITTPVIASMTEFNGLFTPNTVTGAIKITGVTDTCNTTTTPQIAVTSSSTPTLTALVATCANDNTHTITLNSDASSVTIGGISATNTSGQVWQRTSITGLTEVEVVVTNSVGCEKTQTIQLQSCNCPTGTLTISSTGNTCGQGTATLSYLNFTGGTPDISWNFEWQKFINGSWSIVQTTWDEYHANTALNIIDEYRFMIENPTNGCKYYSDSVTVTALQAPSVVIVPSSSSINIGDEVFFAVDDVPGYTYLWTGIINGNTYRTNYWIPQNAGTFSVTVNVCNGSCCTEETLSFTVVNGCFNPPSIQNVAGNNCSDVTFEVPTGSGTGLREYSVVMSAGGTLYIPFNAVPPNGQVTIPTSTVTPGWTGTYTITVRDALHCETTYIHPYTRSTAVLSVASNTNGSGGSLGEVLDAFPTTYSLARVWMVKAYRCANNVILGSTGLGTVEEVVLGSMAHQNNISEGYVVYDNANTCSGLTTKTANDLITDVNAWLSSNGYNATLSWNNSTHIWTYSSPDANNEKERLQIMYSLYTPGCTYVSAYLHDLITLDLPCQCP